MLVTFTNASGSALYLSCLYKELAAGESVQTRRSSVDLEREEQLKAYVQAGTVTLAFTKETADDAAAQPSAGVKNYTNMTRPGVATVPIYTFIFNTDDNAANWSDGVNWRANDGSIT